MIAIRPLVLNDFFFVFCVSLMFYSKDELESVLNKTFVKVFTADFSENMLSFSALGSKYFWKITFKSQININQIA